MQIHSAAFAFRTDGTPVTCREFGHGHINCTFHIATDTGADYVLQKINTYVFKDPVALMDNISKVTAYLHARVDDPRQALHFIPARDGLYYFRDETGEYWRMYDFIGGFCLDMPESDEDFYQSALAFGRFQHLLSNFPAETLAETIPEFHNTVDRYRQFRESLAADPCGRAASVQEEIAFLLDCEEEACHLQKMRESGDLPLRVTHNDTKMNNVLLDRETRKSLCVLDLDTVMPGLSVHDFGDSIRFGAATAAEDEPDADRMHLDLHLFEVYTRGFLEAATTLTPQEVELLPLGALNMTVEVAVRFLKDYLDGDLYFKTAYPTHNLVRARTQIRLAADMRAHYGEMCRIVENVHRQAENA